MIGLLKKDLKMLLKISIHSKRTHNLQSKKADASKQM